MGLFVSTTGTTVSLYDLGVILSHPTVDYDCSQFTSNRVKTSADLTAAILSGALEWRKTAGGAVEPPSSYDPDFLEVNQENTGPGEQLDRSVTFRDLIGLGSGSGVDITEVPFVAGEEGQVDSVVYADFGTPTQRVTQVNYINPTRQRVITYADIGTPNQRIIQVDYTASVRPGVTARKVITYTLVSGRYRRDSINWSIV